jgi:FtsH-binding integral membrane protein
MVLAGFILMFTSTPMVDLVWSIMGAFLFCGFILYDTSQILLKYNTDEYISAVISLYLDFINLFLDILRILAATRR